MSPASQGRGSFWKSVLVAFVLLSAGRSDVRCEETSVRSGEDLAGPIVKARLDVVKDALSKANLTGDEPEKKKTIAQIIDEALEQEFPEEKVEKIGKDYNETAKQEDATVETVIKVSGKQSKEEKEKKEAEKEAAESAEQERAEKEIEDKQKQEDEKEKSKHIWNFGKSREEKERELQREKEKEKRDREKAARQSPNRPAKPAQKKVEASTEQEVDRIIDSKDNVYVLSKPKDGQMGLTLDPQLVRDLTMLITSSGIGGMIMEAVRQPVINGYFIAGSIVGPGGFKLIKELVQVESLAQIGVQLLLFTLGLEFSLNKLRAVRSVALLGGIIEIFLFILVAGITAKMIGASVHEGIFVGALVSMSSTSIVVKCLTDAKATNSQHGQITIGTLILQDCMVGLLFAFMPVLANNRTEEGTAFGDILLTVSRVVALLLGLILISYCIARTILPPAVKLLAATFSHELFQLVIVAFCLSCGYVTGHLGLSTELGAFIAGVMLSATEDQEHILGHLENVKAFFMSLFIASTGLVMSPSFLMQHLKILAGGVLVTIFGKCTVISGVVWIFKFPLRTALAVGLNMAQIGEFAFVLLSVAGNLGLLQYQVYMLLMGITALSLLLTPFLLQASSYILQSPVDLSALPTVMQLKTRPRKMKRSVSSPEEDVEEAAHILGGQLELLEASGSRTPLERYERPNKSTGSTSGSAFPSETKLNQRSPCL